MTTLILKVTLFFFFTVIDKQVLQFLLMSLVSTDANAMKSLMCEEARVPGENPRV